MESLTIEIINPKAKKLIQDLADLKLISISQSSSSDEKEWDKLSKEQQSGILEAVKSIESGHGIPHQEVMAKLKQKLIND